jgi:hypothetical protein
VIEGLIFLILTIEHLTTKYLIKHRKSTPYHPRANGQTKKTNGILCKIITKLFKVQTQIGTLDFLMLYGLIGVLIK